MHSHHPFLDWVCQPETLLKLDIPQWETALTLGRRHGVSGRWYPALSDAGVIAQIPAPVRHHLHSDFLVANDRVRAVRWEINRLVHALGPIDVQPTLLKGAAYIAAGLPPGNNRMVSDVDILVPFERLDAIEMQLRNHGWQPGPQDEYDEKYYRDWMHELPPFQHAIRGTSLDVHHNILPRTSDLCPDAALLLARAVPLESSGCAMLEPADMVLHSVLHGFYGGEFGNCFRDVLDVHELLATFAAQDPSFHDKLLERALELRAGRPLWLALRQVQRFQSAVIPRYTMATLGRATGRWPTRQLVSKMISASFLPSVPPSRMQRYAMRGLLVRSHWVKMPLRILLPHLTRKLQLRVRARFGAASATAAT